MQHNVRLCNLQSIFPNPDFLNARIVTFFIHKGKSMEKEVRSFPVCLLCSLFIKSESWFNLEMTSHDARLAQILLAPSQHSNYFALTAILRVWPSKAKQRNCCLVVPPAIRLPIRPLAGKTTCVANTDVSKKISKCQQLKTWSLQKTPPTRQLLPRIWIRRSTT